MSDIARCEHPKCDYIRATYDFRPARFPCLVCLKFIKTRQDLRLAPDVPFTHHPNHSHDFVHAECVPEALRLYYIRRMTNW